MAEGLLEIRGLRLSYRQGRQRIEVLAGVDLSIGAGEIVGLAGGSGAGKTSLARCILRLVSPDSGSMRFEGHELGLLSGVALRRLRPRLQLVFQDALAAFNPRATVERVIDDPIRIWRGGAVDERRERIAGLLYAVGLSKDLMRRYPHELSGGQRQRVALARALATDPALIVLDEPVSALDVSVRGRILNLLLDIRERTGVAYLFIAHDLAVMAAFCDRICVMDGGRIVEEGEAHALVAAPREPMTRLLVDAMPRMKF